MIEQLIECGDCRKEVPISQTKVLNMGDGVYRVCVVCYYAPLPVPDREEELVTVFKDDLWRDQDEGQDQGTGSRTE